MWSKLSPLGYRHSTAVSLPWHTILGTTVGKMQRWWLLRSDVHRLLHMCHVLIKVNNILTWERLLPYFLKVLGIYIAVWAGEFINTACSEWWGFCFICWCFYNELFVLVVTFTLLCPHNFVTCLTETLYIESYNCLVWKFFPILYIFLYCTVSNCYHARDIFIIYGSSGGLCVYPSCWVAVYVYSWINI